MVDPVKLYYSVNVLRGTTGLINLTNSTRKVFGISGWSEGKSAHRFVRFLFHIGFLIMTGGTNMHGPLGCSLIVAGWLLTPTKTPLPADLLNDCSIVAGR